MLGDPCYYGRFGFAASRKLLMDGEFSPNFQVLSLGDDPPQGSIRFHEAFYVN